MCYTKLRANLISCFTHQGHQLRRTTQIRAKSTESECLFSCVITWQEWSNGGACHAGCSIMMGKHYFKQHLLHYLTLDTLSKLLVVLSKVFQLLDFQSKHEILVIMYSKWMYWKSIGNVSKHEWMDLRFGGLKRIYAWSFFALSFEISWLVCCSATSH